MSSNVEITKKNRDRDDLHSFYLHFPKRLNSLWTEEN